MMVQLKQYRWVVAATLVVLGLLLLLRSQHQGEDGLLLYTVKAAPFSSKVVESGVLRSMNSITISSSLPSNRAKIIKLVREGKYVNKGDLLVEFDDEPLLKDKQKTEADIHELEGLLKQAAEEYRLQRLENDKTLAAIAHDIKMLKLENRNNREGDLQVRKRELMGSLSDARNEWQQAKTDYEDVKALLKDGFVTKNEVEQARIKMLHAKNAYQLQQKKIQVLNNIAIPAENQKAESEVSKREKDLERQKKMASMSLLRSQAVIERTQAKLNARRAALAQTEKYLKQVRILAPASGFVIFREVPILTERRKVHVGDSVWTNQGFMVLPDISKMAVEIKVREVDIHKVKIGQAAVIQLDSYPDLKLAGSVASIGAIAESDAKYRGGKFFRVNVLIRDADQRMRPGMTARTEISAGSYDSILQIPLNAVFSKKGKDYCYVWNDGEAQARSIETGVSNDNFVVIHKGLRAGEQVLLAAPDGVNLEQ